ncbi:MAG: hypothetical protein GX665_01420 [Gammaproteobacteria bacterium]|nr:hypothetical protein [Gammaproteobacteria bacterium]
MTDNPPSRRALAMGALGVSLIACTAVAIIAIITDYPLVAATGAVLAVASHLLLWRLLNQAHCEAEGG